MKLYHLVRSLSICLVILVSAHSRLNAAAETAGTGVLEGRISSAGNGASLVNAIVTLAPSGRTVSTNEAGLYRVTAVPAGDIQVKVSYYGMESKTVVLNLQAGGTLRADFELVRTGTGADEPGDSVIQMEAVSVTADRQMSAQSLSLNEQRVAPNIKDVVAVEEYGHQSHENVGEFFHFLPGVSVGVPGDGGPGSVSLRGLPANFTNIYVDGGQIATARNNSRQLVLEENVSLVNISRIEITKVPTPDLPASGLGGSINLITKNGFELAKAELNYRLSTNFHSQKGLNLKWKRGHNATVSPRYSRPSFDFSYQGPINKSVAVTIGASTTWRMKPGEDHEYGVDVTPTWNRVSNIQTRGAWMSLPQLYRTHGGQLGIDWKVSPRDMVSVGASFKQYSMYITRSILDVHYGAGATGGETFTQGAAAGVGFVEMGGAFGWNENLNKQTQFNLKYEHRGDVWNVGATAAFSESDFRLRDMDNGHFRLIGARIPDLVIRGDNIFRGGIAQSYLAKDRSGATVDIYNGANYVINNVASIQDFSTSTNKSLRLNAGRNFDAVIPFTLKAGLALDNADRDRRSHRPTWNFRPNGATDPASRLAGKFDVFDEAYLRDAPTIRGIPFRDISHRKVFALYKANPSWFVLDEVSAHQNLVSFSNEFEETVAAAYIRSDVRTLADRLWIVAGVRFERTEVSGRGPLNDIGAQYRRNSDGSFALDTNGQRIPLASDALGLAKLRFRERGAVGASKYDGLYPSLNMSYNLSDHLVIRAAYAQTIGRPNVNFIIPGTTISDPDVLNPTITINNPDLLPWTARNFDLSFETYDLKGGSGSLSVFQKNIEDFFGSIRTPVTDDLLRQHGLPADGTLDGYELASRENVGDAKITGVEFSYRQNLDDFLPVALKGLQLHMNFTKLTRKGDRLADFSGFVPSKFTAGIHVIRPRYFIKLNYITQAKFDTGAVAASATELPNTRNYQGKYEVWSANAEYSIGRRYTIFASTTGLGRRDNTFLRYAPETPDFARMTRAMTLGYYVTIGVKGTF